ncbi:MAG: hypothetical protein ICCCNLDF_01662 [Planctomycetes bacterium]|nr:hypothetical protein [Planctomycetota bacterium]
MLQTFVTRPVELVHLTYRRATGRAHGSAFRGAKSSESGDGESDPDPDSSDEALAKSDSKLVGTPNHPFWSVTRQTWVEMGRLQPGERLLLSDGREAVVETLEREYAPAVFENWTPGQAATGTLGTPADPTTGTFTTYNFEVADWHAYFFI